MIKAYTKTFPNGVDIDGLVNRGGWFGKTWLVLIGSSFDPARLVVEADYEQDVIDEIVDSKRWKHLLITDELCEVCQAYEAGKRPNRDNCECTLAGNYGEPIDETLLRLIERCDKVDYFAKKGELMTAKERWKYKHWWLRAWQFSDRLGIRIFVLDQLGARHTSTLRKAWINWQKRNSSLQASLLMPAINKHGLHIIQRYTKKLEQEVLNETADD